MSRLEGEKANLQDHLEQVLRGLDCARLGAHTDTITGPVGRLN
jgi:hypothetical protein